MVQKRKSLRSFDERFGAYFVALHQTVQWITPTTITVSRIIPLIVFVLMVTYQVTTEFLLFPLLWVALFDIFDGVMARACNLRTRLGGFADQAFDKVCSLVCLWTLYAQQSVVVADLPTWMQQADEWVLCSLFMLLSILDGTNFLIRFVEAVRASYRNKEQFAVYWTSKLPKDDGAEQHAVSSNLGKLKVWALMIGTIVMSIGYSHALAYGHLWNLTMLMSAACTSGIIGIWLAPHRISRALPYELQAGIIFVVFYCLFASGKPWWTWYTGEILILVGTALAVGSTLFQLRRWSSKQ